MADFVPCDRLVQKSHYFTALKIDILQPASTTPGFRKYPVTNKKNVHRVNYECTEKKKGFMQATVVKKLSNGHETRTNFLRR